MAQRTKSIDALGQIERIQIYRAPDGSSFDTFEEVAQYQIQQLIYTHAKERYHSYFQDETSFSAFLADLVMDEQLVDLLTEHQRYDATNLVTSIEEPNLNPEQPLSLEDLNGLLNKHKE